MREYYLCEETQNFKEVGNVFPQCCYFIKNLPKEHKDLVYIATDAMMRGDIVALKNQSISRIKNGRKTHRLFKQYITL